MDSSFPPGPRDGPAATERSCPPCDPPAAGSLLHVLVDALLEVVFPTRCAGCELPGELLCAACRDSLPLIDAATACPRCFAPHGWLVCTECWDVDLGIDGAVAVGLLERPLSRCVTIYKDAHERRLADTLGGLLAEEICKRWAPEGVGGPRPAPQPRATASTTIADAVVPVPASARAVRSRGFDHGLLLAQSVARCTGIPCIPVLRHVRSADQRTLSREQRLANVSCAFDVVSREPVRARRQAPARRLTSGSRQADHLGLAWVDHPGPPCVPDRVLLIDDVLTTGATMCAAAAALRAAGAREVKAGFLARAW